jgi:hypothetical protein
VDEEGNEFCDSEGYYMAQRTENSDFKKAIAWLSIGYQIYPLVRYVFWDGAEHIIREKHSWKTTYGVQGYADYLV